MYLLIIDDEKKARDALRFIVQSYDKTILINEAESVEQAERLIADLKPDIIFLDIQLGDGSGFDLLNKISPSAFKIIFITAYHEYAIQAFRFSALDYILKPVNPAEVKDALEKARSAVEKDAIEMRLHTLLNN